MIEMLARYWWALVLRGIAGIVFGVLALLWPGITLEVLVIFFGAYMLVDGVFAVISAIGGRAHTPHWGWLLLEGLLGIAIGIFTFVAPVVTAFALLMYIAAWAIVTGVIELVQAIRLRREIEGEFWLGLAGVLSIGFGVLLVIFPLAGALSIVWLIGAYAVAFGIVLLLLGFRLRGMAPRGGQGGAHAPA
ncbi:MAG TPA: HdeD family acid-resistance protein [Candidatus Binatia bacterium]